MRQRLLFACISALLLSQTVFAALKREDATLSALETPFLHGARENAGGSTHFLSAPVPRQAPDAATIPTSGVLPPASPPSSSSLDSTSPSNTTAVAVIAPNTVPTLPPNETQSNMAAVGSALQDVIQTLNSAGKTTDDANTGAQIGASLANVKEMQWIRRLRRLGLYDKKFRDQQRDWIDRLIAAAHGSPQKFRVTVRGHLGADWRKKVVWLFKMVLLWLRPHGPVDSELQDWVVPIMDSIDQVVQTTNGEENWNWIRRVARKWRQFRTTFPLYMFGDQVSTDDGAWKSSEHQKRMARIAGMKKKQMQQLIAAQIDQALTKYNDPHAAVLLKQAIAEANQIDANDDASRPILNALARATAEMSGIPIDLPSRLALSHNLQLHRAVAVATHQARRENLMQKIRAQALLSRLRVEELRLRAAHLDQKERLHLMSVKRRLRFLRRFHRLHERRLAFMSKVQAMKAFFRHKRRQQLVKILHAIRHSKINQQQRNTTREFLEATAEMLWDNFSKTLKHHQILKAQGDATQKAIDQMQAKQLQALKAIYLTRRQKLRNHVGGLYNDTMTKFKTTLVHLQERYNETIAALKKEIDAHNQIQAQMKRVLAMEDSPVTNGTSETPHLDAIADEVKDQQRREIERIQQVREIIRTRKYLRRIVRQIYLLRRRYIQIRDKRDAVWLNVQTALLRKIKELRREALIVREKLLVLIEAERNRRSDLREQMVLRQKVVALTRALMKLLKRPSESRGYWDNNAQNQLPDDSSVLPYNKPATPLTKPQSSKSEGNGTSVDDGLEEDGDSVYTPPKQTPGTKPWKGRHPVTGKYYWDRVSKSLGMSASKWNLPTRKIGRNLSNLKKIASQFQSNTKNTDTNTRHKLYVRLLKRRLRRQLHRYLAEVNRYIRLYKKKLHWIRRREARLRKMISMSASLRLSLSEKEEKDLNEQQRQSARAVLASEEEQKSQFRQQLRRAVKKARWYLAHLKQKLKERLQRKRKFLAKKRKLLEAQRAEWINRVNDLVQEPTPAPASTPAPAATAEPFAYKHPEDLTSDVNNSAIINPDEQQYQLYAIAYRKRESILMRQRRAIRIRLLDIRKMEANLDTLPAETRYAKKQLQKELRRINKELHTVARLAAHYEDLANARHGQGYSPKGGLTADQAFSADPGPTSVSTTVQSAHPFYVPGHAPSIPWGYPRKRVSRATRSKYRRRSSRYGRKRRNRRSKKNRRWRGRRGKGRRRSRRRRYSDADEIHKRTVPIVGQPPSPQQHDLPTNSAIPSQHQPQEAPTAESK